MQANIAHLFAHAAILASLLFWPPSEYTVTCLAYGGLVLVEAAAIAIEKKIANEKQEKQGQTEPDLRRDLPTWRNH